MSQPTYSTRGLDHHGIVAGTCKQLKIAEIIDTHLPKKRRIVSHREAVSAMILNMTGFTSRAMYLTPEFFKNKP